VAELLGHKSLSRVEIMTDPETVVDAVPTLTPGMIYNWFGKEYLYAKVVDLQTVVGWSMEFGSADGMDVTGDRDGSSVGRCFAGIAQAVVPVGSYGLFQISGLGAVALLTDTNIAATSFLCNGTTDGECAVCTVGTTAFPAWGRALAADAAAVLAAGAYYLFGIH
jgi:hypothetical protein